MNTRKGLQFACECVSSSRGGYSEPWAGIAKHKLLPNGTKEQILNVIAREPRTISQIAAALDLSAPTVHSHVRDMLSSELLRESKRWEKIHPAERYYEPNFPVMKEDECAELCAVCDELATKVAALFQKHERELKRAFNKTPLAAQEWNFAEVAQCVYARVQRRARQQLEQDNTLTPPKPHRNGIDWVFWAVHGQDPAE
jgi:DNA-binding transcriptional ArsR family regulator